MNPTIRAGPGSGQGGATPPVLASILRAHSALACALSIACAVALLPHASQVQAADKVYFFVDERGLSHFSNVPHDPRYRLWMNEQAGAPRFDERIGPLALFVSAPRAVPAGSTLHVSLALPASASTRGLVEIAFDPAVLTFEEATVEAFHVSPGRLHLEVDPGIAAAFGADVRFAVRPGAPGQTLVRASVVDLESEDRTALHGIAAEPVRVQVTRPKG
jgi:hypothetical protein